MTNILITGGTGFVGSYLVSEIKKRDPEVTKIYILSRNPAKVSRKFPKLADLVFGFSDFKSLDRKIKFKYMINLAGESIADKKWSDKQKEKLRQSRIEATKNLVNFIGELEVKPKTLISASAVGYYGSHDDELLDEDSTANKEFTHFLCKDWEDQANLAKKHGVRVCTTRLGIVIGKNGGAVKKMLTPFKFGLGGKIASGKQVMSWIHINDVIRAMFFLLENKRLSGAFNLCAPQSVDNKSFTTALAKTVSRPALCAMPLFLVKFLFGEMGEVLLAKGQNVYPRKLLKAGFHFRYKRIETALLNATSY